MYKKSVNHHCNIHVPAYMAAFASRWFPRTIKIPARLRDQPLQALYRSGRISLRLAHVLHRSHVLVLGELHGQHVGDFAWKRNCGFKTLQELDSLASAFNNQPSSRNHGTTANGAAFAVPKSVRGLRFDELPITKRLANVVRTHRVRTLGNLNGRTPFELLHYDACGWRTLSEVEQLIQRAVCGEFDVARINESQAMAELLTLLERGIAKLPPRDRQFLLARIGGMTFAEIGRRYGCTRAHVQKVVTNALGPLKKTWGPRIPRLLEIVKRHSLSIPNGSRSFRLSKNAQLRLIAQLDKNNPDGGESPLLVNTGQRHECSSKRFPQ